MNTPHAMKYAKNPYDIMQFFHDAGANLEQIVRDRGLLLISLSGTGILQVLFTKSTITIDLLLAVIMVFALMTILGVMKHFKEKDLNARTFLIKTVVQASAILGTIVLGYSAALVFFALNKIAGDIGIVENPITASGGMYFVYSAYMISFTYNFIKSADLLDQLAPNFLPKWFSAPFRKYRKTGKIIDIIDATREDQA